MIEKLTKEQIRQLKIYRDKWMAIGLDTSPANRKEAERGITEAYKIAGKKKPKIVWCLSPLCSGITRYCVLNLKKLKINNSVGDSVRDSVWASVGDSVRTSVRDSVRDSVWASVGDSVNSSGYGQHDASWLGFYDYFKNELKLEKQTEKLKGLWIIAQNANWFLPHENICWVSERHDICKLNKRGVIHADGGPAIHYPDGFSVWALNGTRVTKEIAETPADKLNPELALNEKNVDIQREIINKIGAERMLKKFNAKPIDNWIDGNTGLTYELYNLNVGKVNRKYLYYKHASANKNEALKDIYYFQPVPPEVNKCITGRAFMLSMIERNEIQGYETDNLKQKEIQANLPSAVS